MTFWTITAVLTALLAGCEHSGRRCCLPGFLENGVTAHRGFSAECPENTRTAFQAAIDAGADWIECDIRTTADGHIVIAHNATVGDYTGTDEAVNDMRLEDLRKLDFASKFRERHGLSRETCPPETILTIEEAIQLIKTQRRTRIHFHLKERIGIRAAGIIRAMNASQWCGFNCADLDWLLEAKAADPDLTLFQDRHEIDDATFPDEIEKARKGGVSAMILRGDTVTAERIRMLREAGLQPGAWTVNDPDQMRRLLEMGLERFYTDNPEILLEIRGKH